MALHRPVFLARALRIAKRVEFGKEVSAMTAHQSAQLGQFVVDADGVL